MSTSSHEEALQAYIARILAVKAERSAALSAEELQAIALDLGLTELDLAAGSAAAERYFQRGEGFRRHQRWDDAISELSAAAALAPDRLDVLFALAEAHAGRWRVTKERTDRDEAEALARRCLDLKPDHEPSFVLLNALDPHQAQPASAGQARWVVPVAIAIVTFGVLTLVTTQWRRDRAQVPPPITTPVQGSQAQPLVEIPVELAQDAKSAGIRLQSRLSQLANYPSSSYYRQAIALTNTGGTEWQALTLQAEYLDGNGTVLSTKPITALATYKAPVRPGDVYLFNDLQRSTPNLARVRLRVLVRQEVPIMAAKLVPRPIEPRWEVEAPAGMKLAFRERSGAVSRNGTFSTVYVKPIIEIENTGTVAVKTLRMAISLYDAEGKLLGTKDHLAVSGEGMALLPGEMRLDRWYESAPKAFHHYRLSVVEIE